MTVDTKLVGLSGAYAGKVCPVISGETVIGRGEECTLQIVDARVSRKHAVLSLTGEEWVLEDLGSMHGTFVNGQSIEKVALRDGDTIAIGVTILRFERAVIPDNIATVMAGPDEAVTMLTGPDDITIVMAEPDEAATVLPGPDDIATVMAVTDEAAAAMAGPDDIATVMTGPGTQMTPQDDAARTGDAGFVPAPPPVRKADTGQEAATSLVVEKKPFSWKWVAIGGGLLVAMLLVCIGLALLPGFLGILSARQATQEREAPVLAEAQPTPLIPPTLTPTREKLETPDQTVLPPTPTQENTPDPLPGLSAPAAVLGGAAQIAFASDRTGQPQIFMIHLDTQVENQLTDLAGGACQPAWSPDGRRLAFTSPCNTHREEYSGSTVFTMDVAADGTPGIAAALNATLGGGDYDPAWAPDGSRIAFTSWRTGRPQIFSVTADGDMLLNLNDDLAFNWAPTWSQDGMQVAFLSGRGGQVEIWTVPTSGGEERRFSRSDGRNVARPGWSPDGSMIVFEKDGEYIPRLVAAPVVDGGLRELLVCPEGRLSLQPMAEPAWSPDGDWLAFETWPDGENHEIAVIQANCTEYSLVTNSVWLEFDAAWRPTP